MFYTYKSSNHWGARVSPHSFPFIFLLCASQISHLLSVFHFVIFTNSHIFLPKITLLVTQKTPSKTSSDVLEDAFLQSAFYFSIASTLSQRSFECAGCFYNNLSFFLRAVLQQIIHICCKHSPFRFFISSQ